MSCATTKEIDLGDFNVESVDRFNFTITKDGVAWTGIDSVSLVFERAEDSTTQFTRAATLETPDAGVWYYDTVVTDFTTAGDYTVSVRVTDGSIVKRFPYAIGFHMSDNP